MSSLEDILISKHLETPDVSSESPKDYIRRSMAVKDFQKETPLFPEENQRNESRSKFMLDGRYNRKPIRPTGHSELCIGDLTPDRRGTTNDPRLDLLKPERATRARAAVPFMGNNNDHAEADSTWSNQRYISDMRKVQKEIQKNHLRDMSEEYVTTMASNNRDTDPNARLKTRGLVMEQGIESLEKNVSKVRENFAGTVDQVKPGVAIKHSLHQSGNRDPDFGGDQENVAGKEITASMAVKNMTKHSQEMGASREHDRPLRYNLVENSDRMRRLRSMMKSGKHGQNINNKHILGIVRSMQSENNGDKRKVAGLAQLGTQMEDKSNIGDVRSAKNEHDLDRTSVMRKTDVALEHASSLGMKINTVVRRGAPDLQHSGPVIWNHITNQWQEHKEGVMRGSLTQLHMLDPSGVSREYGESSILMGEHKMTQNPRHQRGGNPSLRAVDKVYLMSDLASHRTNEMRKNSDVGRRQVAATRYKENSMKFNDGRHVSDVQKSAPIKAGVIAMENYEHTTRLREQTELESIGKSMEHKDNKTQWKTHSNAKNDEHATDLGIGDTLGGGHVVGGNRSMTRYASASDVFEGPENWGDAGP